jgi:hypothetical protein
VREFPGSRIGMGNIDENRRTFGEYVDAYVPRVQGIYQIRLSYRPDFTADTTAFVSSGGSVTEVMAIEKDELRRMLRGVTQALGVIRIDWSGIHVFIQDTGNVNCVVEW